MKSPSTTLIYWTFIGHITQQQNAHSHKDPWNSHQDTSHPGHKQTPSNLKE